MHAFARHPAPLLYLLAPLMSVGPEARHAQLIGAIAERRDRAAFAELFGYFAPRVKAYLLRAGAGTAAEEMAQETLLTVWHKAAQFDPARPAAGWIFAIARNLRIDAARRARLAPPAEDPSEMREAEPGADAMLAAADSARRLRAALGALSAEQAEVVRLAYFDDRPQSEIEAALGIPLGTVKSRLRLALAKLRALLDDAT